MIHEEFDRDQQREIDTGIAMGLDTSWYAKPEFMAIQMQQIRLGLADQLDVSIYAREDFDCLQMEQIRKGLAAGIDCSRYAFPSISFDKMYQIRKGLIKGIDLSGYARLEAGILRELRKAILSKVSIVEYIREGYTVDQLEEIRHALERGLDIDPYLNKEYRGASIHQIWKGLNRGLNPSVYAKLDYQWRQMREIRYGMEHHVDVSVYSNCLFSWKQMRELRLGLEAGLDVTPYRSFMYTERDMERIRRRLENEGTEGIIFGSINAPDNDKIEVFVSNDEMEACIEIRCSQEETVSSEEILARLRKYGVTQGILPDTIDRIVREKCYRETVIVAQGKPGQRGRDGWYEYFFKTKLDRSPTILPDGSADYRNIRWYELVEEGQKIACYHEAESGAPGHTVTGKLVPPRKGEEKNVLRGKGFQLLPDGKTYTAAFSGKIELTEGDKIEISRLCVMESVSLPTGNVDFDGCVYVKGNVGSGTVIQATEDVIVNGFVEAAVIRCGGEILLRQGANGSGGGLIQAEKKVTGKFFEAIRVISGGDIFANYCLNCDLYAKGSIIIQGKEGMLAGGMAQAVREIRATNVGNRAVIRTVIRLGMDEALLQEKKNVEKEIAEVNEELAILGNSYLDFQKKYPPEIRNAMSMYLKIENAIYTKELQLADLYKKLKKSEEIIEQMPESRAVIKGCLYEGTEISIGSSRMSAFNVRDVTVKCINNKIVVCSN